MKKINCLIILIFIILLYNKGYSHEYYFSAMDTYLYNRPNFHAIKICKISQGKIIKYIAKNNIKFKHKFFSDYWYKVIDNHKIGWIFGSYAYKCNPYKHKPRNIKDFIDKFNFAVYLTGISEWESQPANNLQAEIGFSFFLNELDLIDLENMFISISLSKNEDNINDGIYTGDDVYFNKIYKFNNGYKLFKDRKHLLTIKVQGRKLRITYIYNYILKTDIGNLKSDILKKFIFYEYKEDK